MTEDVRVRATDVTPDSLLGAADVATIQSPSTRTLQIRLINVEFSDQLSSSTELQNALARSATSVQTSTYGWNQIVVPELSAANLRIVDQRTARITIPQFAQYSIAPIRELELPIDAIDTDLPCYVFKTHAS